MFTLSQECAIFFWSVLCGVIIMVLYDVFSVIRNYRFCVMTCNIFDASFVVISSAIMFFVLFSVANGYIRAYEFFGAFLGGTIYKITLGRFVCLIFCKFLGIISSIFAKIFNFLLTPITFMYKIIYSIIGVLCRNVRKIHFLSKHSRKA